MLYRQLLLPLAAFTAWAQTALTPRPTDEMQDPAGQKVVFRFQTLPNSVQIYTCRANGQGFRWTGPDPDAILVDHAHKLTVHHYQGPTWEAVDGSIVHSSGALARHYLPQNATAVHWLELPAQEPAKLFAKVTFIHRIDTSGGLPPGRPCDAQHVGDSERVNYSATYLFFAPQ